MNFATWSRKRNRWPDRPAARFFPRMDGGEMWSRWDMQDHPPDILITNYSMMNIMLMRSMETPIFDATRQWLAADRSRCSTLSWTSFTPTEARREQKWRT